MKNPMEISLRFLLSLALGPLALMLVLAVVGSILETQVTDPAAQQTLGHFFGGTFLILMLIMAFAAVPLVPRFVLAGFISMQRRLENQNRPLIRFIVENKNKIGNIFTYVVWGIYLLGLAIASPYLFQMLRDLK